MRFFVFCLLDIPYSVKQYFLVRKVNCSYGAKLWWWQYTLVCLSVSLAGNYNFLSEDDGSVGSGPE
jgi:hypothetical protein